MLALAGDAEAPRGELKYSSLVQVLLATVAAEVGNLTYKVGLLHGSNPETLLSAQAWVFSTLATAFVWLGERRINPPAAGYRYGALAAASLLTAFILLLQWAVGRTGQRTHSGGATRLRLYRGAGPAAVSRDAVVAQALRPGDRRHRDADVGFCLGARLGQHRVRRLMIPSRPSAG